MLLAVVVLFFNILQNVPRVGYVKGKEPILFISLCIYHVYKSNKSTLKDAVALAK